LCYPTYVVRAITGYDLVGVFTTSGFLIATDLRYAKDLAAWRRIKVAPGEWHAFVRSDEELVVVHADAFDVVADERLDEIVVESGLAGIFDARCLATLLLEGVGAGIIANGGVIANANAGDESCHVYAAQRDGQSVKLRIDFGGVATVDRTIAMTEGGRIYSPEGRYKRHENITHPAFGDGRVTSIHNDDTITVRFTDGARKLIHGRS
jgi:hypothetical protein